MATPIKRVLAPVLVLAAGIGIYQLLQVTAPEPAQSEDAARPVSVYTAPVAEQSVTLDVTTQGEVRPRTSLDLVAQVSGRVVAVSPEFTEGGVIVPGETLLEIEDTDYRLALHEAEARVAQARVAVEQALADADVARKQLRNDPDPSPLALKEPQVAQARAQLAAAEAGLEQAQIDLARTRISLPFAGRLTATRVDRGQFISAGTVLGSAFATDVVEVRLPFSDQQLAALGLPIGYSAAGDEGMPVSLKARVAGAAQTWQGRLTRLDAAIDPDTRALYGLVEVPSPYALNVSAQGMPLAVGLFVEATVTGRRLPRASVIPAEGLRAGDTVYLIDAEGSLEIREVSVAHRSATRAVISDGLRAGEQVVVSAIRNPIAGMAVIGLTDPKNPTSTVDRAGS